MTDAPEILLSHHLKTLKLPTLPHENSRNWPVSARPRGLDRVRLLSRLMEPELIDRERRMDRRLVAQ